MRSIAIVAAGALIAVAAVTASAVPGRSVSPGSSLPTGEPALAPVTLRAIDAAPVTPTLDPGRRGDGAVGVASAIVDPGSAPGPAKRPAVGQPRASIGIVVKPTPTPRPTARPAPRTADRDTQGGASGGGWRTAGYSWYGPGLYGNGTACGQTYTTTILGTAHRTLPCGTRVTFRNPSNGRTITVRVIDRGPYVDGRTWDLSYATCSYLRNCYTGTIQYRFP